MSQEDERDLFAEDIADAPTSSGAERAEIGDALDALADSGVAGQLNLDAIRSSQDMIREAGLTVLARLKASGIILAAVVARALEDASTDEQLEQRDLSRIAADYEAQADGIEKRALHRLGALAHGAYSVSVVMAVAAVDSDNEGRLDTLSDDSASQITTQGSTLGVPAQELLLGMLEELSPSERTDEPTELGT